jgi:hypothetical protein
VNIHIEGRQLMIRGSDVIYSPLMIELLVSESVLIRIKVIIFFVVYPFGNSYGHFVILSFQQKLQ